MISDGPSLSMHIYNRQKIRRLDRKKIKIFCTFLIEHELQIYILQNKIKSLPGVAEFNLHLVEEPEMMRRHKKSHGLEMPTDVIGYGYLDELGRGSAEWVLGEVFVSITAAVKAYKRWKTSLDYEALLYMVHGILHLFGYDDQSPAQAKIMRKREAHYMSVFKHGLPILTVL